MNANSCCVSIKVDCVWEGTKQGLERIRCWSPSNRRPTGSEGAILETPSGQIDATVETQIENIAKAIGEARNCVGEQVL